MSEDTGNRWTPAIITAAVMLCVTVCLLWVQSYRFDRRIAELTKEMNKPLLVADGRAWRSEEAWRNARNAEVASSIALRNKTAAQVANALVFPETTGAGSISIGLGLVEGGAQMSGKNVPLCDDQPPSERKNLGPCEIPRSR